MKNWYLFLDEGEYYNYGKIIDVINDILLVEITSSGGGPKFNRLFHLPCLSHSECFLFETEKGLNDWLKWMETPTEKTKPTIVNFKKEK